MKYLIAAVLSATFLTEIVEVAHAGPADYYIKRIKNDQYDPPYTPYRTVVGGPYSSVLDCQPDANAAARDDHYEHLFLCQTGSF